MNKYIVICMIGLTCLLTACGYTDYLREYKRNASGPAVSSGGIYSMRRAIQKPIKDSGTVSGSAVSGTGIHSADNVTSEMQTADYWISKTVMPDKILMSQSEIEAFNQKMIKQLSTNPEAGYYELSAFGETIDGERLMALLSKADFSKGSYYFVTEPVTKAQWNVYKENCNLGSIANFNTIRYGIICSRADVRAMPTADYITDNQGDKTHDVLQDTALAVNEPVLVLHTSRDGKWLFVVANEYAGWVKNETVGLCRDKTEWKRAQEMKKFLVITGDKVCLKPNPYNNLTSQREFTMGTKLELAEDKEYISALGRKMIHDNYAVKIPVRRADGILTYELAAMPAGKDVHEGYIGYTRANVLRLAFKMLGNIYGWGGMFDSRDCSSLTRDIYLCFGLRLPRNSSAQALIPGEGRIDISGLSDKEKIQKLYSVNAGTILQMPGHVMIYLGCVDHNYFVISANGSSALGAVTVNALNIQSKGNEKTWLSRLTTIVGIP